MDLGHIAEADMNIISLCQLEVVYHPTTENKLHSDFRGIMIIIHGLNEHSGRYTQFAKQLTNCYYGVYAMDWIGHGGSDGLHGYVPSLDHVVADTGAFLEKIKVTNPGVPCFLFGHSTGGAVVLKAASYPHVKKMLEGVILTSPALRVKPAHPIVGAVAPLFSLVVPKLQFKGANKKGIPVSRDPAALAAKYSDPLVYTGPIRVRTGHEILRICSYLMRNLKSVTAPFLVLHGTADKVTDPLASQDLYDKASSAFKDIKLYEGFLHDLLFEPERDQVGQDIIDWMGKRLSSPSFG
uniref:Serine aminopeptidase S33 domain-containing protein n=1 Tax=Kalanchoe fedtschenkoi TaxID=63787 RepID=A0A7N0T5A7_KALFE